MAGSKENDAWHLRRCMAEPQEGGAEPQRQQRKKKTLQGRKPPWLSTAQNFL